MFYYKKYKNCKFGDWCRYSHNITDITEEQFKTISVEIETLKSEISALKEENKLLYKRLHAIEENCDKRKNILENVDDYENDSESDKLFKCAQCEFKSHSKRGLNNHIRRKHIIEQLDGNCRITDEKTINLTYISKSMLEAKQELIEHYLADLKLKMKTYNMMNIKSYIFMMVMITVIIEEIILNLNSHLE